MKGSALPTLGALGQASELGQGAKVRRVEAGLHKAQVLQEVLQAPCLARSPEQASELGQRAQIRHTRANSKQRLPNCNTKLT